MEKNTILIADDEPNMISANSRFIKSFFPDYNLETFPEGLSLKKRLEKSVEDVKVIITDNQMPNISGSEIIKEYANKLKIPFILVYGGIEDIGEEAVKNGAFAYLIKPVPYKKFIELIKKAITK